jgi:hypothetical protein
MRCRIFPHGLQVLFVGADREDERNAQMGNPKDGVGFGRNPTERLEKR